MPDYSVSLNQELNEVAVKEAAKKKISVPELMRKALKQYLGKPEKESDRE